MGHLQINIAMYLLYLIIDLGLLYLTARELLLLLRLPEDFDLVEKGLSCALMACSLIILSSLLAGYVEIYSSLTITFIFLIEWNISQYLKGGLITIYKNFYLFI